MSVWTTVLSNVFLSFAAMLLLAGLAGTYYGKGRSRSIGVSSMLLAVLLLALFAALTWPLLPGVQPVFDSYQVLTSMAAVGAALLGAVLAGAMYVVIVMRS